MPLGILSPVHFAFLLVIVVLLFGAKRLPELGSSLGSGLRGFKESLEGKDAHAQVASVVDTNASTRPTAPAPEPAPPQVAQRSAAELLMITPPADEPGCLRPPDDRILDTGAAASAAASGRCGPKRGRRKLAGPLAMSAARSPHLRRLAGGRDPPGG
jgi:sec-independent protein translocase protein TatA